MSELTFEQMLEESFKTIRNGEVVDGTVIDVKPDEIILNIGYKADGIITRNEYTNEANVDLTTVVSVGDQMSAKVLKVNDGEGQVLGGKGSIYGQGVLADLAEGTVHRVVGDEVGGVVHEGEVQVSAQAGHGNGEGVRPGLRSIGHEGQAGHVEAQGQGGNLDALDAQGVGGGVGAYLAGSGGP